MNQQPEDLSQRTDAELVALCQKGREDAFTQLAKRYHPLITAQVAGWHLKPQDAEDFTQEAWIALFHAISSFDIQRETSFSSFLKICIENKLKSAARKHKAFDRLPTVSLDDDRQSFENLTVEDPAGTILEQKSTADFLVSLRNRLSPREAEVLSLFLQGLSYREIAETLSVSEKSVDSALCRIRRKVKQLTSGEHEPVI